VERPWWEAEIRREAQVLAEQNAQIEAAILLELKQQQSMLVDALREANREALQLTERRWRSRDEQAIRAEIKRLSDISRPYFESQAPILEPFYQERMRRPE